MKQNISFFFLLIIINFYSCNNNKDIIIEAIDFEFNKQLLTGEGLDPNLFNTKDILQYYQVSNYNDLSKNALELKLDEFITQNYKITDVEGATDFTILFYKKNSIVNYSEYLYEAARDNQNGGIAEYKENLIAKIRLTKAKESKEKIIRKLTIYDNDLVVLDNENTIQLSK